MVFNSIYRGETRDFTRNVGAWKPARVVSGPKGKVEPRGDFPRVVVREHVMAQKVVRRGDKVRIDPKPIAGVEWAEGWLETPRGRISVSWRKSKAGLEKVVSAPDGIVVQ